MPSGNSWRIMPIVVAAPVNRSTEEGDRVDDPVDEGVQRDAEHRNQADGLIGGFRPVTDVSGDETIEQMQGEVAGQQAGRRRRAHLDRLRDDVQERARDEHSRGEAGEIAGVAASPASKRRIVQMPALVKAAAIKLAPKATTKRLSGARGMVRSSRSRHTAARVAAEAVQARRPDPYQISAYADQADRQANPDADRSPPQPEAKPPADRQAGRPSARSGWRASRCGCRPSRAMLPWRPLADRRRAETEPRRKAERRRSPRRPGRS